MRLIVGIMALSLLAGCQADTDAAAKAARPTFEPAATNAAELDFETLPQKFPLIAEMEFETAPKGCRLAKPESGLESLQYVLTSDQSSRADDGLYFQVTVNGEVRTLKQVDNFDSGAKTVRYLKTIDEPFVDVLIDIATLETPVGDVRQRGIVARIKAWDEGMPLMCGYNRIEVEGDCDI